MYENRQSLFLWCCQNFLLTFCLVIILVASSTYYLFIWRVWQFYFIFLSSFHWTFLFCIEYWLLACCGAAIQFLPSMCPIWFHCWLRSYEIDGFIALHKISIMDYNMKDSSSWSPVWDGRGCQDYEGPSDAENACCYALYCEDTLDISINPKKWPS